MANPEHVTKLQEGVEVWNIWRRLEHQRNIDLRDANLLGAGLAGADLSYAELSGANLTKANLRGANLSHATLHGVNFVEAKLGGAVLIHAEMGGTDLSGADLSHADLSGAGLSGADLRTTNLSHAELGGANLIKANLLGANLNYARLIKAELGVAKLAGAHVASADLRAAQLRKADLTDADLCGANLIGAHLQETDLGGANLSDAKLGWTVFASTNLAGAKGLGLCNHAGPSTIGVDTLVESAGHIPEVFLRGCGVPEQFITYARSLVADAIQFYSCFISYSSQDQAFAERLHADLLAKNLRCWFAPEDLKIGDRFHERIEESILLFDKVMIVLSDSSMKSRWVEREVNAAREREDRENRTVLFPIRIDDAVMEAPQPWAADIRRSRHVGDFSRWKDHDSYRRGFERLLRDLEAKGSAAVQGA
jgi:uncharacterized protein YjbI with pentapeptide repeats